MRSTANERTFMLALLAFGRDLLPLEREVVFAPPRKWRFDFAWAAQRVAVEIDGGLYRAGGGRHNTRGDQQKMAAARRLGWHVLHFAPYELQDGQTVVETVRRALKGASDANADVAGPERGQ